MRSPTEQAQVSGLCNQEINTSSGTDQDGEGERREREEGKRREIERKEGGKYLLREGGEWREEEEVVGGLVELGGRCLWRQSMEPVGLLLAECSEELFPSPGPPPSPHSPAGFLRFLLDNLLQRERVRLG